jgi:hypothetical protein
MKHTLIALTSLLLIATGLKAQDDEFKPFRGGAVIGLNLSQVDGDRYFGYYKPGISTGGFVSIHFTECISAQAELLFSQKGSHGDAVIESPYVGTAVSKCHIGLSYVEVPLVLQYRYKSFVAEAGGSYAVLVHTNEWILEPQALYIDKEGNRFNTTDVNYIFGLGRQVWKHWHANVRFQYSLFAIRPQERIPIGYSWGTKGQFNNLLSIRLLYSL